VRYLYDPRHEEIIVSYRLFGLKDTVTDAIFFKGQNENFRYIRSKTVTEADAQHEFNVGSLKIYHNLNVGNLAIKYTQLKYEQLKDHQLIFFIDLSSMASFEATLDHLHKEVFPFIQRGRLDQILPSPTQQKITLVGYCFDATLVTTLVELQQTTLDDFNLQIEIHPETITHIEQINPMLERMTEKNIELTLSSTNDRNLANLKRELITTLRMICTGVLFREKMPEGVKKMQEALMQTYYQPEDLLLDQVVSIVKKRYSPKSNWFDAFFNRRQDKTSEFYSMVYNLDLTKLQQPDYAEEMIKRFKQLSVGSSDESQAKINL